MRQATTCSAVGGERVQRVCSSTKSVPRGVDLIPACNCNTRGGTGCASTQTVTRCARRCYTRTDLPSVQTARGKSHLCLSFCRMPGAYACIASRDRTERKVARYSHRHPMPCLSSTGSNASTAMHRVCFLHACTCADELDRGHPRVHSLFPSSYD